MSIEKRIVAWVFTFTFLFFLALAFAGMWISFMF
jgi:hypothetical protein